MVLVDEDQGSPFFVKVCLITAILVAVFCLPMSLFLLLLDSVVGGASLTLSLIVFLSFALSAWYLRNKVPKKTTITIDKSLGKLLKVEEFKSGSKQSEFPIEKIQTIKMRLTSASSGGAKGQFSRSWFAGVFFIIEGSRPLAFKSSSEIVYRNTYVNSGRVFSTVEESDLLSLPQFQLGQAVADFLSIPFDHPTEWKATVV